MTSENVNVSTTRRQGLCTSCEACRAVCPVEAISMKLEGGQPLPIVDAKTCIKCKTCIRVCPGINFDANKPETSAQKPISAYTGYSKDAKIRATAASGGLITALLTKLITNSEVDKVFVLDFKSLNDIPAKLKPTSNIDEIFNSAKSKYIPASVFQVIKQITNKPEQKYAIVGTSCQFQAIKRFLKLKKISDKKIIFLGLVCDRTLNFNVVRYFEDKFSQNDEELINLDFRNKKSGNWLGDLRLVFSSGREVFADRTYRTTVKDYFQLKRCLYCLDKLNKSADIVFGDNYLPGEADPKGKSSIIVQSKKGENILSRHKNEFVLQEVEPSKVISSARTDIKESTLDDPKEVKNRLKKIRLGQKYNPTTFRVMLARDKYKERARKYFEVLHIWLYALVRAYRYKSRQGDTNKVASGKNIVITGGSFNNKGAEAMIYTIVPKLSQIFPHKKIYMFSIPHVPDTVKAKHNFHIVNWDPTRPEKAHRKIFKDSAMWLDISGFALSSKIGVWWSLIYLLNIIQAARYYIPFIIMPQSIGPFDYPMPYKPVITSIAKLMLTYPIKTIAREESGKHEIMKLGCTKSDTMPDIVLTNQKYNLDYIFKKVPDIKNVKIKKNSVAIIPNKQVLKRADSRQVLKLYEQIIEKLLALDKNVYILRHSVEDLLMCEQIKERFKLNKSVHLISNDMSCIELEAIVKKLDFIVASRYHSVVHAYRNGIPAIVLGWARKYKELTNMFRQNKYQFDANNFDNKEKILMAITRLSKRSEKESNLILRNLSLIRKKNAIKYLKMLKSKYGNS